MIFCAAETCLVPALRVCIGKARILPQSGSWQNANSKQQRTKKSATEAQRHRGTEKGKINSNTYANSFSIFLAFVFLCVSVSLWLKRFSPHDSHQA